MKIQQRTNTAVTNKRHTNQQPSTSFEAMFDLQGVAQEDTPSQHNQQQNSMEETTSASEKEQHLDKVLHELEGIMLNLEQDSKDHKRAQLAINSLRDALQDMPSAFPLTAEDREEAKTLLAVESKRIDGLKNFEG